LKPYATIKKHSYLEAMFCAKSVIHNKSTAYATNYPANWIVLFSSMTAFSATNLVLGKKRLSHGENP
jgi:hypothetical protein